MATYQAAFYTFFKLYDYNKRNLPPLRFSNCSYSKSWFSVFKNFPQILISQAEMSQAQFHLDRKCLECMKTKSIKRMALHLIFYQKKTPHEYYQNF